MAEEQKQPEALDALLRDLNELTKYLHERGQNAYTLAQRFLDTARQEKDQKVRTFDEQQARMLDYQHYIWHEIAGMVEKLAHRYQPGDTGEQRDWREEEHLAEQETAG